MNHSVNSKIFITKRQYISEIVGQVEGSGSAEDEIH
jgi:hypothetical protein